jgi:chromate transporter
VLAVPFPMVIGAAAAAGYVIGPRPQASEVASDREPGRDIAYGRHALRALAIGLPLWLGPIAVLAAWRGPQDVFTVIAAYFAMLATVTFGGAYAVLAAVAQAAVGSFGWLTPAEMADGLGLAETTPGPLILVLQHVGYLAAARHASGLDPILAGLLGGVLTSWVTFVPSMIFILLAAPAVEPLRRNRPLSAALAAVTAAVVGVILSLALWFAIHVLFAATATMTLGPLAITLPVAASIRPAALILALGAGVGLIAFELPLLVVLAATTLAGIVITLS